MRKTLLFKTVLLALLVAYQIHSSGGLAQTTEKLYIPSLARQQWTRWLGPDGGSIVALAISPQNPQIMYAGTWGSGVFKSTNGGATWSAASSGLTTMEINALAVDPNNSSVVYAGPYRDKLYKTVNGGQSWTFAGAGLQDQAIVYGLAIDPTDSNRVYIGTRGVSSKNGDIYNWSGILYRSLDGGTSWTGVLQNVNGDENNQEDWAYSIAVDPANHNRVYAAMHLNGVYASTDTGATWQPKNGPALPGQNITDLSGRSIIINPINPNILYYGVWHRTCVYKTDNAATSWTHQNNGCGLLQIYSMALHPNQPDTVYLADFHDPILKQTLGVYKTTDGGIIWSPSGLSQDAIYSLAVDPATGYVFAGTSGDGLYRSTNGGSTWTHRQSGISNATAASILVQPDANKTIFAVVPGSGVTRLLAPGQAWQDYNLFLPYQDVSGLARNPSNPNRLFAYSNSSGLWYTDLNLPANGWIQVPGPLPSADSIPQLYAADHPLARREDLEAEVEGIPQVGEKDLLAPMGNYAPITAMAFSTSSPNEAFLITLTTGQLHSGIYRSQDGGMTWGNAGLDNKDAVALAVSPLYPGIIYVATRTPGVIFYATTFSNWQETYLPPTNFYALAFAADGSRVYAGTNNGIYVRIGEGSWTPLALGGVSVTALAVDPTRPGRLYAGTTQGVYMTQNYGESWNTAYPELSAETIQSIGIDTLDYHFVYFGTKTRGIVQVYFP